MSSSAVRSIGLVAAVAAAFSSLTLWLIDSWIKYIFFVFEIFVIVTIYLIINNYEVKLSTKYVRTGVLNFGLLTNVLFILFALVLLAAEALRVQGGTLQLILALLVTSILPGYALLNVFGFTRYFSRLEMLVLSYIVGYAFTGLLTLTLLPIRSNIRTPFILGSFVALGLISALKRVPRDTQPQNSLSRNIDILALALATSFYLVSFYLIYPDIALRLGSDISRHYASSIVLWRTPELYRAYGYLLAHLHEAAFIAISDSSVPFVQTALVTLNLLMPVTFYVMAKHYLEGLDGSLAAISTLFYSTFSGFAWICLAQLKLSGSGGSTLNILSQVNDKAYYGAMYLAQPYLWFVPLSFSFIILMVQLMLLRKKGLPKRIFIALFSLLTIASFMVHVTEAVILALFLSLYGLFSTSSEIRLDDALLASIFGLASAGLLYSFLQYYLNFQPGFSLLLAIGFGAASLAFVYAYRRLRLHENLVRKLSARILGYIASASLYAATFGYFLGLIAWVGGIPSFHAWMVVEIGLIPWFIYPVFLGSIGILAFLTFYYLRLNFRALKTLMPFVALIVFSLLFGKALTYINLNFFDTGYWEKRFTAYFFLGSAVLASVSLVKLVNSIRASWNKAKGNVAVALILTIVVVYGVQSSFVVIEYYNISNVAYVPSIDQMNAVSFLASAFDSDKYAFAITPSLGSNSLLVYAAPPYVLSSPQIFWISLNPEIPLVALKAHNLSHAYIYTDSNDAYLLQKYGDSWFSTHLLPILPVIYKNGGIAIYNASSVSFPSSNSSTALVLPFDSKVDPNKGWLYVYDILSLGGYNFTAAYDLDSHLFKYNILVLPIDPPAGNIIGKAFVDDFTNQTNWKVVSGTWQFTNSGAIVGQSGQYQDAILLSPVPAENFTASVTFRPMAGDLKVANYVSIIYDWKDKNNFKYAGLMFDGSGTVYAYFSQAENGLITVYPKWPGLNTGLKWKFGGLFNLTVTLEGRYATLYVNGRSYLSTQTGSSGGLLGIRSTRFYQVSFTNFTSKSYFRTQLRDPSEFLSYVAKGGKLVVLNTNGYGYFASKLFGLSSSTFKVDDVQGQSSLKLPENITVDALFVKEKTASIVAYYGSGLNQSIYAVEQSYGKGKITYVNIYPITKAIEESAVKPSWYGFLAEALKPAALQLPLFAYTPPPIAATVKELSLKGEVNVNASSVIFPFADFGKIEILSNNKTLVLSNITSLQILNGSVQIKGSEVRMGDGYGFYSRLVLGTDISIVTNGSLSLSLNNGTILNLDHVNTIKLTGYRPITVLARQPKVSGYGQAVFIELYSGGDIYQKTRTQGQNLIVNGTVLLDVYLSDSYSWLSSLNIQGGMSREPPIPYYNELASLPQATFWSMILLPVFIALVLIARKGTEDRK